MPSRPTCAPLLARLQSELGPTAAPSFDSDALQTALDRRRADVIRLPLTPVFTLGAGGAVSYLDYYAQEPGGVPLPDWEGLAAGGSTCGWVLQAGDWTDISAGATADCLTGHWTFPADQRPPVLLTGHVFDFWAVVGDLLKSYAAAFREKVDFSSGVQAVHLSQQYAQIQADAQAAYGRSRRRVRHLTRSDAC